MEDWELGESFDLLGGLLEDEETEEIHSRSNRNSRKERSQNRSERSKSSSHHEISTSFKSHRSKSSRGPLDEKIDSILDKINYSVPITKQNKMEGVYIFGSRIMRIKEEKDKLFVIQGSKKYSIEEFIAKFEKVELVRLKGLQSGLFFLLLCFKI